MGLFDEELKKIKADGLLRSLRTVSSPQGPEIEIDGKRVLNFCSNDYLGLAGDPRLVEAAARAAERYGTGSGAARLISGNSSLYGELEDGLARLKGTEAALLFNSGYHANIGVIPVLAPEGTTIFSDELNHASLIDGCRLAKGETMVYRHNDLGHLEGLLKKNPKKKLIVTEAVFSMEGDLCPLDDLLKIAEKYGALVYLDEAHAVGVFGENGEGCAGVRHVSDLLICMGTLGKAFGSYGAFVTGSGSVREYLINKARSFIFTTGLPPPVLGASLAALKIVREDKERRGRLWDNIRIIGRLLKKGVSPVFSIPTGSAEKTMEMSRRLLEEGVFLQGIRPPTVPEGTSRLRLTVTSSHGEKHLERLSFCLKEFL